MSGMRAAAPYLNTFPLLIPIPRFNRHIIAASQHDTRCGMHRQAANIIRVRLERGHFFMRIIIEHAQLEIIRASHEPIFAGNKTGTSHWHLRHFECLDDAAGFVIVNVNGPIIKTG